MYNKLPPKSNSNKSYHKSPNPQQNPNKSYHKSPNPQQNINKNQGYLCNTIICNENKTLSDDEFDSNKLLDIVRTTINNNIEWDLTKLSSIKLPNTVINGTFNLKENDDTSFINIIELRDSINNLKIHVSTLQLLVPSPEELEDKTAYFLRADGEWSNTIQQITTTDHLAEGVNNLYYTNDRVSDHLDSGNISNILITGEITTKAVIVTSDKQTKENINHISDKKILEKMKPVEYNYISDNTKRKRYGLVAQELEEIAPELVFTDNNNVKGVNYNDIIALLIKENQYMKKKLLKLEKEVFSN